MRTPSLTILAVVVALGACASTSRVTRHLDTYRVADDDVSVSATVTVTACEEVEGLTSVASNDEVVVAAIIETSSRDCDAMGLVVDVFGTLPEPLGDRQLVTRPLPAQK